MALASYGLAQATGYPDQAAQQTQQVRENTALEAHLSFLKHLQEQAGNAANRAMRMADRLLGCEPAMIGKNETLGAKSPAEPPLVAQVEEAARVVAQLLETIHAHLNRLERV